MFPSRAYLTLAEELGSRDDEAARRSAVSRAYYATFCACYYKIRTEDPGTHLPKTGEAHRTVWTYLANHRDKDVKWAANMGNALRDLRNRADYDATLPNLEVATTTSLDRGRKIFDILDRVNFSPT